MAWKNLGDASCLVFEVVRKNLRDLLGFIFEVISKNLEDFIYFVFEVIESISGYLNTTATDSKFPDGRTIIRYIFTMR